MKIRKMKPGDIRTASKIVGLNYTKEYQRSSRTEMEAMFKKYVIRPQYIVAEDNGKIVGLGGYTQSWMDYHVYTIFWVNVLPQEQRKGIGHALVKKIIENIKKENAKLILLSTDKPEYYSRNFKFKKMIKVKNSKYVLMSLDL